MTMALLFNSWIHLCLERENDPLPADDDSDEVSVTRVYMVPQCHVTDALRKMML